MNTFDTLDRAFSRHRRWLTWFGCAAGLLTIVSFFAAAVAAGYFLLHPAIIGEFFGMIVQGYRSSVG